MKVAGDRLFAAPRETVWRVLTRPEAMAKTIPGLERLEVHDAEHWTAHVRLRLGPARVRAVVACELVETRAPDFAHLRARGDGHGGGLRMDTSFHLVDADGGTRMSWEADVELTGRGASIAERMMHPVAERQVGKVMASLEQQIAAEAA